MKTHLTAAAAGLLVWACATWSVDVAPGDATRPPRAEDALVAFSGAPFEQFSNKLADAAHDACRRDRDTWPAIADAIETIDWESGVMSAEPLEFLAEVTLTHRHAIPTEDFETLRSTIERTARELGANVAAIRSTRRENDDYFRTVVFLAYDVDCGAAP